MVHLNVWTSAASLAFCGIDLLRRLLHENYSTTPGSWLCNWNLNLSIIYTSWRYKERIHSTVIPFCSVGWKFDSGSRKKCMVLSLIFSMISHLLVQFILLALMLFSPSFRTFFLPPPRSNYLPTSLPACLAPTVHPPVGTPAFWLCCRDVRATRLLTCLLACLLACFLDCARASTVMVENKRPWKIRPLSLSLDSARGQRVVIIV